MQDLTVLIAQLEFESDHAAVGLGLRGSFLGHAESRRDRVADENRSDEVPGPVQGSDGADLKFRPVFESVGEGQSQESVGDRRPNSVCLANSSLVCNSKKSIDRPANCMTCQSVMVMPGVEWVSPISISSK